jgi:hypothetical protein
VGEDGRRFVGEVDPDGLTTCAQLRELRFLARGGDRDGEVLSKGLRFAALMAEESTRAGDETWERLLGPEDKFGARRDFLIGERMGVLVVGAWIDAALGRGALVFFALLDLDAAADRAIFQEASAFSAETTFGLGAAGGAKGRVACLLFVDEPPLAMGLESLLWAGMVGKLRRWATTMASEKSDGECGRIGCLGEAARA